MRLVNVSARGTVRLRVDGLHELAQVRLVCDQRRDRGQSEDSR
jgi:hypothetical protein